MSLQEYPPVPMSGEPGSEGPAAAATDCVRVGLIDSFSFSRDCLVHAISSCHPDLNLVPFGTVEDCLKAKDSDLAVILVHLHSDGVGSPEAAALHAVKALREGLGDIPVVVLSDTPRALETRQIRTVLAGGARGVIPTLTTDLQLASAAIRLVKNGGTFAPMDRLIRVRPETPDVPAEQSNGCRLTPRQEAVLKKLHQGKANKIIAYELGMAESTVKIHIRHIMRKLGATNRTQAVYKAQQLREDLQAGFHI